MIWIRDSKKTTVKAVLASLLLLIAAATGFGQQQINLTAGPTTTALPDGNVLPMWGYTCGAAVSGSTATCGPLAGSSSAAATGALGGIYVINAGTGYKTGDTVNIAPATGNTPTTAAAATVVADAATGKIIGINVTNHGVGYTAAPTLTITTTAGAGAVLAAAPAWSPVMITIPFSAGGANLTVNLTNNLSFGTGAGQSIPTSIVIVGQVGGGLGAPPVLNGGAGTTTSTQSPSHANAQGCASWFIASLPPGSPCTTNSSGQMPPNQGNRVQSMGTEVSAGAPGAATSVSLNWPALKPGTYLLESGTHPSIQVPMGLIGMLVVTTPPSGSTAGTAYPVVAQGNAAAQPAVPAVTYNAEVPLEFSEIDPVQNKAVDIAVRNAQFSETRVWTGLPTNPNTGEAGCGNPGSGTLYQSCYPPAVNYTPFYYLINGQAFDKTNPSHSLFEATAGASAGAPVTTGIAGNVLVRMVNAGLKMHVPAIVGSQTKGFNGAGGSATVGGFTLAAEDGNPVPNATAPRVKTEVFMAAGKTYDVLINGPATSSTVPPSLPVFDRELSLSANSSVRDAGMVAYIGVNGSLLPGFGTGVAGSGTGKANPDTYNSIIACGSTATSCTPLVVTDPSKGVIANDINVYGVAMVSAPTSGSVSCSVTGTAVPGICANGTFTYTPTPGGTLPDTFSYCANGAQAGTTGLCTTVTLAVSSLSGSPVTNNITYTAKMATFLKIASPGPLSVDSDPNGLPLQIVVSSVTPSGVQVSMDPNGGFTATASAAGTYSFTYIAQNSQGRQSSAATVTLVFPTASNLQVHVLDAQAYNNCNGNSACIAGLTPFPDYRWIIEEDKTFYVDPNCTTNSSSTTRGCASVVSAGGTIPTFGTNFHTSTMDFVAQGCTGPLSCEGGQTWLNPATGTHDAAVCDVGNGACRLDSTGNGSTAVLPGEVHLDPSKRYYISVLPGDAGSPFNPAYLGNSTCNGTEATTGSATCGHAMSGAEIPAVCNILGAGVSGPACTTATAYTNPVSVLVLPTPLPTGKLSVIVFEDDYPLNGEQDSGGGSSTVAPLEPGLGGFNLVLWDTYGGLGDVTGQDTYDAFNQPLANGLAGTIDPVTGMDACPLTANPLSATSSAGLVTGNGAGPATATGMTGTIVTCPKYESDGQTLSPLAGQAVIDNLMPDKFSVQAYPGADRIARGEQWVQTNTLDGQHAHDAFIPIGGPSYFQEYGPAGYHVMIGFANPAIINARHNDVCNGNGSPGTVGPCTNTITGQVDVERLSRTPDQRLYPSGSRDALAWTQCWVSLGDPDGEDFQFTFCDANGNFQFANVPGGAWRLTIGDQWNDQIIDGLSVPANVGCTTTQTTTNGVNGNGNPATNPTTCPGGQTLNMGNVGVQQWQSNIYTKTCIDDNKNGICDPGEIGIPLIYTMVHYRDGHNANALTTDFNGVANFNETFPLFNWYVIEADSTRYKTTGIHTVYDAGGPADGSPACGNGSRPCGTSGSYNYFTNSFESLPLPADLSVPGAVYCASADCGNEAASFAAGTAIASSPTVSTGRIDPPWVWAEGWSGLTGQSNWIEFGKAPYAACNSAASPTAAGNYCAAVTTTPAGGTTPTTTYVGENGGIYGNVTYASTRPFDDASQMIQQPWAPNIPGVTVNLYQEGFAADGVTKTLTMVDTTTTSSWDAWAQGFYPNGTAGSGTGAGAKPYLNCPGQGTASGTNQDVFFFTLFDQPNYLDWYNAEYNGGTLHTLPYNSQYKCYDAMHIGNQLQPAPYDGKYMFPSSLGVNPSATGTVTAWGSSNHGSTNGATSSMAGTNCTICVANPDSTDKYRVGTPMLPPGKYVVEVIMPPGYEVYKEEDKNLLIGDNYIAPATQQFGGLGADIFILPDQASVASMYDESGAGYNGTNYQNSTTSSGLADELSGVPGFPGYTDPVWPCAGEMRVVPDYLSLFPQAQETAPFAGATRPLCDRKEVTLTNQMAVNARFFLFTATHIASKYTGVITDDYTSEFDPFSPQFGEKFGPPNQPVSTRDYLGNELSRVYSDHWGAYDGLTFSSWEVNPPNITGYSPSMMTQCMNDPGPITDSNPSSPTYGQLIQDPLYNPAYSDFCYMNPYMPGLTTYNDTPVVPTEAFVGAGYNNVDCAYPDATPAIAEVDGDQIGPWVSAAGHTLTITALGDQQVNNAAYSGPSANTAPFNMKTVGRHYGFGSRCTAVAGNCTAVSSVTVGGASATVTSWTDSSITVTVPAVYNATTNPNGVPMCAVQQQVQYGGPGKQGAYYYKSPGSASGQTPTSASGVSYAYCGELVITAGNSKQSIDSVTVTIGGKAPAHVSANQTIQSVIDAAAPGDLIIVDPTCTTTGASPANATCSTSALHPTTGFATQTTAQAAHTEMLLMWKPVRLQGVGAATSIVDANAFPSGKLLDPWRRHVNCLFGLSMQGVPLGSTTTQNPTPQTYDSTGQYNCPETGWKYYGSDLTGAGGGTAQALIPQVDRIPLEAVVGWDATLNGNLAEQLQEPSLMGAYEGAGVTVLSKGIWTSPGESPWTDGSEPGAYPGDALLLQDVKEFPSDDEGAPIGPQYSYCEVPNTTFTSKPTELSPNQYPSNFECNPSSIDGLTIRDSSQGGGGVFVHGWAHNLQIANNRVYNNAGTLSGGITVGQGEFPPSIQMVATGTTPAIGQFVLDAPPSCQNGTVVGQREPYCLDLNVNVHNNYITSNSSLGDELFSGTLAGGGGASFCTGSDYYKFQYNWVCGNLSSAEGGGVAHLGFIYNGDIEHNTIALNQSTNPTIPTNGGGLIIMGTPDTDPVCGTQPDADCPPGLSDGIGPNLVVNANLIQANTAESGSGGGIRLQQVSGTDISTFPNGCFNSSGTTLSNNCSGINPKHNYNYWNSASLTNNIIVNNVAGWDGAGVSLEDSLNVSIINNTIASNDSLASSGVLTQSLGTPDSSAPAGSCSVGTGNATGQTEASCPQSAGLTSQQNETNLTTSLNGLTITCPPGMTNCQSFSNPVLRNNLIWQNRSFIVGVSGTATAPSGTGTQNQQNLVTLFDAFSGAASPIQSTWGTCATGVSYWDIGVRGDAKPGPNTGSGFALNPLSSFLDDSGYDASNGASNPAITHQYCNGPRVPPTCSVADGCGGPSGYGVPPGIADATGPNPVFTLTPSATVDEGNNWINVSWGPMALSDDSVTGGTNTNYGGGNPLANYALNLGSPAIDFITVSNTTLPTASIPTLSKDFFGNPRPFGGSKTFDVGAIQYQGENPGPVITQQPTNQTVALGNTATFTVVATGTPTLTYQWQFLNGANWINFGASGTGTTTATLTTVPTTAGANGLQVRVVVTDGNGLSTTSNTVTLTVSNAAPLITHQPSNQTVTLGNTATFSVTAVGNAPLTYQWQFLNGVNWINFGASGTGTTTATLTTVPTTAAANGLQVRVVVTDGNGLSTTSNTVTLTVSNAAPLITHQPSNRTVTLGNTATFSVTAVGNAPLTYQWQMLNGVNWINFGASGTGTTTATMTTVPTTAGANGLQIRVVVTDGNGLSTTSNTVTLTVSNAAPLITHQPTSQAVTHPATATFSVTAVGNAPLTYQWQFLNGVNWINFGASGTGTTTATLTTNPTTTGANGLQIRVVVTDGNGLSTASNTVTLTVN